MMKLRTKAE